MPPKAAVKRKAVNGYKMPDKIPEGTVLTTVTKKNFKVGKSIGVGGFGEIYLCSEDVSRPVGEDAPYALKIEPHENGPLFVEMNFYIRAASAETITAFIKSNGLKSLGMPSHRGSGSTMINGEKYRFLVMDRFGSDLQKIFQTGKNPFSDRLTFNLAIKILDVLEYIHSQDYVHNDIKAQNLLLGMGKGHEDEVYVVDFGLATKFIRPTGHLEFKPDPKKAHDGTIEYTSCDAHIGTHSRRSDLEILGYNLVHWMSGTLPWMSKLTDPNWVHAQKKLFMESIKPSLEKCFAGKPVPDALLNFLKYVQELSFEAKPDYNKCRNFFKEALKKAKYPLDGKLDFGSPQKKSPAKRASASTPRAAPKAAAKKTPKQEVSKKTSPLKGITKAKLKDNGTQTSPAFVKAAKAAARAKKQQQPANPEVEEFVSKAVLAAKKALNGSPAGDIKKKGAIANRSTPAKKTPTRASLKRDSSAVDSPAITNALSNPTPAMMALMAKKAAEAEAKASNKKKPKASKCSPK